MYSFILRIFKYPPYSKYYARCSTRKGEKSTKFDKGISLSSVSLQSNTGAPNRFTNDCDIKQKGGGKEPVRL